MKVNVLKYIVDEILKRPKPKDAKRVFVMSFFEDQDCNIEFDVEDKKLMNDLQKIADTSKFTLSGDGVWFEMDLEDGYNGSTLFGNYWRDAEMILDGDVFFHVNKEGVIYAVDFD